MDTEHAAETELAPEAVWKVLKDIDNWPRWDTSMEAVTLRAARGRLPRRDDADGAGAHHVGHHRG